MSVQSSRTFAGYRRQQDDGDARPVMEMMMKSPSANKHPLQRSWTLWFFKGDRVAKWEDNLCEIITVNTVEDFWGLYNNIKLVSDVNNGCEYSFFREGVKPMWEDPSNCRGGRWIVNMDRKQRGMYLDNYWLEILLCLIGEAFDNSELINGAVVSLRSKMDRIGVWVGDVTCKSDIMDVGRVVKDRLAIGPGTTVGFEAHTDTMLKKGSIAKTMYAL